MNEKRGMLYIGAGMAALLVISLFIALGSRENGNGETVICISPTSPSAQSTENTEKTTAAVTATTEPETASSETAAEILLNINTANAEELAGLSGIGPELAGKIVLYRENNGNFANIEEIMNVSGIGEGIFNRICNYIYVDNPVYTEPAAVTTEETYIPSESGLTLEEAAPININTAGAEELMLLPYVTEEIALKIIELRDRIHEFSHVYELLYVEELEQNQVAEIIDFVTVGQ